MTLAEVNKALKPAGLAIIAVGDNHRIGLIEKRSVLGKVASWLSDHFAPEPVAVTTDGMEISIEEDGEKHSHIHFTKGKSKSGLFVPTNNEFEQEHVLIKQAIESKMDEFLKDPSLGLIASLEANGIKYMWMGESLGGFQAGFEKFDDYIKANPNDRFAQGITKLLKAAEMAKGPVALMCSERDVNKCHRREILEYLKGKISDLEITYLPETGQLHLI